MLAICPVLPSAVFSVQLPGVSPVGANEEGIQAMLELGA